MLLPAVPLARQVPGIVTLAVVSAVSWSLVACEGKRYADAGNQIPDAEHTRRRPH